MSCGLNMQLISDCCGAYRSCFTSGHAIIEATVRELASTDAGLLLTALVNRFQYRTGRCVMMVPWIRSVLMHHTAYLCSAPGKGFESGL
jgi:U3 small nucleolar RNA-associated protein 5